MGVLAKSVETIGEAANGGAGWVFSKTADEMYRLKKAVGHFSGEVGSTGPMPIVIKKINVLLTEVSENTYTLWTKDKAQAFYIALATQLKALLELMGDYTSKPSQLVKNGAETLYVFTLNTLSSVFHSVDDDLLSPMITKTQSGVYTLSNVTSNTAIKVFTPIASAISNFGVTPSIKVVNNTKKCFIHTSAWVDNKTQLTDIAYNIKSKGENIDKIYLNGFMLNKFQGLLATFCGLDTKFTGGFAQGVFTETVEEFKSAKRISGGVTSVGAPVYQEKIE